MTYLPDREADLVTWTNNFDSLVSANPVIYGLDIAQAAAYAVLNNAFVTAYAVANNPSTRTPSTIVAKNVAMDAVVADTRDLVAIAQAFPGMTDVLRSDLGITVPDVEPTPAPIPTDAPGVEVVSVFGRTVTLRLNDTLNPANRGKPAGVGGATILSFVGATAPAEPNDWSFQSVATRTTGVQVTFPATVAEGSQVWLTAFWYNTRGESGPTATPVSTYIAGGLAAAA